MTLSTTVSVFDFLDVTTVAHILGRNERAQNAAVVTRAFRSAAAHLALAFGGGIIRAPAGKYLIKELDLGFTENNIGIVGEAPAFYDGMEGGTEFHCPTATEAKYAVWIHQRRDPAISGSQCWLENIFITSDGSGENTGVPYGLIISENFASLRRVSVTNFKHGLVGWGWNSNAFTQCSFSYNTLVGVALLDQAALSYQAPELEVPSQDLGTANSLFTFLNCNIRRNQIGIVLRNATRGTFTSDCVVEANYRQALIAFDCSEVLFHDLYLEQNNDASSSVGDYAPAKYPMLLTSRGEILKGSANGVFGADDIGYDILIGEATESTSFKPDSHLSRCLVFDNLNFTKGPRTRGVLRVRSGFGVVIERPVIKDISGALTFSATPYAIRTQFIAPVYRLNGGGSPYNFLDQSKGVETVVQESDTVPIWHGRTNNGAVTEPPRNDLSLGVGKNTLRTATTGGRNTAIGANALRDLTTGSGNVALGVEAGARITSGSGNTLIGQGATASAPTQSDEVNIASGGVSRARFRGAWDLGLAEYPSNEAALAAGLTAGQLYKSSGNVKVVT